MLIMSSIEKVTLIIGNLIGSRQCHKQSCSFSGLKTLD